LTRRHGAIAAALLCLVLIAGLVGCAGPNAGAGAGEGTATSAGAGTAGAGGAADGTVPAGHVSAELPPTAPEVLVDDPRPELPVTVDWDGTPVEVASADRILTLDRAGALSRMVWSLGLGDRLVGRDTATDFPGAAELPQVTPGGHSINAESILKLRPDVILTGCQLRLVDDQGRETAYSSVRPGISLSLSPCVPADTPGPVPESIFELEENPAPRPETYTLPLLFRTADDFVPARLDVFWERPTYAALQLTAEPAPDQGATSSDTTEPEEG